jgi:hypothetical protein
LNSLVDSAEAEYLFQSLSGIIEYVVIDTEMSQVNDYFVMCFTETENKLEEMKQDLKDYESGAKKLVDPEYGDVTGEAMDGLGGFEIPAWEDNFGFIAPAMCLVHLHIFTEKSLKSLCSEYSPKNNSKVYGGYAIKVMREKNESQIEAYIRYLKNDCAIDLSVPDNIYDLINLSRKVRNEFAHGDWDVVRESLKEVDLPLAFQAVTHLFEDIESEKAP